MLDRIEVVGGDAGWPQAAPLLQSVWPPEVIATLPWRDVAWARADRRLLGFDGAGEIICHVGIFWRDATWDGRAVKVGGIGGVATRADCRRRGVAGAAVRRAAEEIRDAYAADFALLFCEPRLAPVYQSLGWHLFAGEVFVTQPRGRVRFDVTDPYALDLKIAPRSGVIDLCGLPW